MTVLGHVPRINLAIATRTERAKDAIPVSGNPIAMAASNPVMMRLAARGSVKPTSGDADVNGSQRDGRIALPKTPTLNESLVAPVLLHRCQSTVHRGQQCAIVPVETNSERLWIIGNLSDDP